MIDATQAGTSDNSAVQVEQHRDVDRIQKNKKRPPFGGRLFSFCGFLTPGKAA